LVGRNGADPKTSTTLRHPPCRTCWEEQACHRWLSQGKVSKPDSQITYEQGQTFISGGDEPRVELARDFDGHSLGKRQVACAASVGQAQSASACLVGCGDLVFAF